MMMNQVARQFQNLAGKGLGADVIVQVFVLSIPLSVAITIPMAVLVATMAAFGRLAGDNEITAIQANGVGFHQLLAPSVAAAIGLTLFTFWFNDRVLPESNHRLSQLMMEIQRAKPTVVLQEKRIVDPTGLAEYRILPDRIDRTTNMMYGVRIFDTTDLQIQRTTRGSAEGLYRGRRGCGADALETARSITANVCQAGRVRAARSS